MFLSHLLKFGHLNFVLFSGELEKIVNLLLILCGCLSRVDRSLLALEREDLTEKDAAEERVGQDQIYPSVCLSTCLPVYVHRCLSIFLSL